MDKMNYESQWIKGVEREEIVKKFLHQVVDFEDFNTSFLEYDDKDSKKELSNVVFKYLYLRRDCSFRALFHHLYVYVCCSSDQLNKLLSFDKDYVSYTKEVKKIKRVKYNLYNVNYADCKDVYFKVLEGGDPSVLDHIITEDEDSVSKKIKVANKRDLKRGVKS